MLKSNVKRVRLRLLIAVCLVIASVSANAQKRFHVDLDYHYYLTVSERFLGQSFGRKDIDDMHGNSLRFAVRYDFTGRVSAGAGIGLDWYEGLSYGTAPVFATCRYKLIEDKGLYAFTNLGYSIGNSDGDPFSRGMMFDLGIGYPIMLTKNFGINIQLGYNLSQFHNQDFYVVDVSPDIIDVNRLKINGCRHSLSFGVGLTF